MEQNCHPKIGPFGIGIILNTADRSSESQVEVTFL